MLDIVSIREQFPLTKEYAYFQSAGMSPVPLKVLDKVNNGYKSLSEHGDLFWHDDMLSQLQMYEKIASLVHCKASDIAFTDSNSLAMSLVAASFKQKKSNFNIVSVEEEFPSNSVPFEYQGIEMRYAKPDNHRYSTDSILSLCDNNTLAVVTSYVQYCTGFRQDLTKLGAALKERNILFIVNATQAFPLFPINMKTMNVDVLTCSVHKWGFCGHIGTLFITTEKFRKEYPSPFAGWLSVDVSNSNDFIHTSKGKPFDIWSTSMQYNFGSSNYKSRLGLGVSLEYLSSLGWENIRSYLFEISDYLIDKLKEAGVEIISPINTKDERSAIISFSLKEKSNADLVQFLEKRKVITSLRNGYVRASVNIFTNKKDVDQLITGIADFLIN
ncbi:MAG TPA: aminotransferase class V-fold PLP-dependent enzyme [Bacteroidales bacterium]|nr:aminotransferase class V-fold PLP-dependent enzyme [Bacteroidales bacterium]